MPIFIHYTIATHRQYFTQFANQLRNDWYVVFHGHGFSRPIDTGRYGVLPPNNSTVLYIEVLYMVTFSHFPVNFNPV